MTLRRIGRPDVQAWVNSLQPYQASDEGLKAYNQREYEVARLLFEKAAAFNPKDQYAWNNLGRALAALGRNQEARRAYERQIEVNPKDAYAYNNLGLIEQAEGHWEEAVRLYRKQLEVNPGDRFATENLPHALFYLRRWAEAEETLRSVQAPALNVGCSSDLAVARVCQGKVAEPKKELESALRGCTESCAWNDIAYYLAKCGQKLDIAQSYARKAVGSIEAMRDGLKSERLGPLRNVQATYGNFLDTYGWVEFKKNNLQHAAELLEAAVRLNGSPEEMAHLRTVLALMGSSLRDVDAGCAIAGLTARPVRPTYTDQDSLCTIGFNQPVMDDQTTETKQLHAILSRQRAPQDSQRRSD